jgi:hypothetical protein
MQLIKNFYLYNIKKFKKLTLIKVKIISEWNKFIVDFFFYLLFIIFYNIVYFLIFYYFNYVLYIIKFIILYYIPVYLLFNLLIKKNILFFLFNFIFIVIINFIKLYNIIDSLNIGDELNIEITLFNINDLYDWYNILKYRLYSIIYRNNIKDIYNRNFISDEISKDFINSIKENNVGFFTRFWDIINNLKFYFMNIFFFDFNNNINILFNNLNISFKAIFNLNNNSNINNEEIIDEVDVVIKYLEEIKNNYNYIYSNKDIYIDNGNKQLFDWYLNLNYQKEELSNLELKILRLESDSVLILHNLLDNKILKIKELYKLISDIIEKIDELKIFQYYNIEKELYNIRIELKKIEDEYLSESIISNNLMNDKVFVNRLFDLHLYNYFLENEKLYYLDNFELGLSGFTKIDIEVYTKANINVLYNQILYYDKLLNGVYWSYRDKFKFILENFESNKFLNQKYKYEKYYLLSLKKIIKEENFIFKNLKRQEKIKLYETDHLIKKPILDSWSHIKSNPLLTKQRIYNRIEWKETYSSYIQEETGIKLIEENKNKFIEWYKDTIINEVKKEINNKIEESNLRFNKELDLLLIEEISQTFNEELDLLLIDEINNEFNKELDLLFIEWYKDTIINEVKKEINNKIEKY